MKLVSGVLPKVFVGTHSDYCAFSRIINILKANKNTQKLKTTELSSFAGQTNLFWPISPDQ